MVRKAIESLYKGVCDVVEYQKTTDPITKLTKHNEVTVLVGKPCKLSFESIQSSNQTDSSNNISQSIKLFIAPELVIKPGSKIIVTQNGVTTAYIQSGKSAILTNHQEIVLTLFEEWA